MRIQIITIGNKMPGWLETGVQDYLSRFPKQWPIDILSIPPSKKPGQDQAKMRELISKQNTVVIALAIEGQMLNTAQLAQKLEQALLAGQNWTFLIGGADGLSAETLALANTQWSLSALTFPHTVARLLLLEQLYRAHSLLHNHPYHRA